MNEHNQMSLINILDILLFVFMICFVFYAGFEVLKYQQDLTEIFVERCNKEYGLGNWTLVPGERDSLWKKVYLGEILDCQNIYK